MRYAVNIPNFDDFADARAVAGLASDAEDAGWDGLFVWDHVTYVKAERRPIADAWVVLTAAALATERLRLGPMVTPLPRRRMSTLARQSVTLDHLSGGRLVQGVGLGSPVEDEYGAFGETTDLRELAARLDESLEVLTRLWTGDRVDFAGEHLRVDDVSFRPAAVQRPRIPIWVAGMWPRPKPFRRAARWDGVVPILAEDRPPTPAETAAVRDAVAAHRPPGAGPFDLVVSGRTAGPGDTAAVAELADAGATWWQEAWSAADGSLEATRARVRSGPPRI